MVLTLSSGPAGVVGFVALFSSGVGLISFSRAAAPVAAAALRTASGSYHMVMAAVAICSILASLAMARAHWLHARHVISSPG